MQCLSLQIAMALLKPTSDPDIPTSPDYSILVHSTKPQSNNKAVHFFKAFCIPGVAVVRHGIDLIQYFTHTRLQTAHIKLVYQSQKCIGCTSCTSSRGNCEGSHIAPTDRMVFTCSQLLSVSQSVQCCIAALLSGCNITSVSCFVL